MKYTKRGKGAPSPPMAAWTLRSFQKGGVVGRRKSGRENKNNHFTVVACTTFNLLAPYTQNQERGCRDAQQLRIAGALLQRTRVLFLSPTQWLPTACNSSSRDSWVPATYMVQRYSFIQVKHSYT